MDSKILRISRRYGKKSAEPDDSQTTDDSRGYTNIGEAVDDISPLVDVSFASGTCKWPPLSVRRLWSALASVNVRYCFEV